MNIEEKVRKLVEKKVQEIGVNIDNIEYVKEGTNYFLRIVIDREEIIDVDTCVEVTNIISPMLDDIDFIKDSYILDITTKEKGEI